MKKYRGHILTAGICVLLGAGVSFAWGTDDEGEQEMAVKESEVPAAALKALRDMARPAKILKFAREVEHGHTYYEGSWTSDHGHIDALVTPEGEVVEIEEGIQAGKLPKAILNAAQKAAGKDAEIRAEKKTIVLYEVKYRLNGKRHEVVYSADGRMHDHEEAEESVESGHEDDD